MKISNKIGERFNRLLVTSKSENTYRGRAKWICKCDCGNIKEVVGGQLMSGSVQSCGCLKKEQAREKGKIRIKTQLMKGTRPYRIWAKLKSRCNNPNEVNYERYGGRGITVCDEWMKFDNFWKDMKVTYEDNLSIDRINNNDGYYKENCKWSTPKEQAANRRQRTDGRFTKKI